MKAPLTRTRKKLKDLITRPKKTKDNSRNRKAYKKAAQSLVNYMKSKEGQNALALLKDKDHEIIMITRENGFNDIKIVFNHDGTIQRIIGNQKMIPGILPTRVNIIDLTGDMCISWNIISPIKFVRWSVKYSDGKFTSPDQILDFIKYKIKSLHEQN